MLNLIHLLQLDSKVVHILSYRMNMMIHQSLLTADDNILLLCHKILIHIQKHIFDHEIIFFHYPYIRNFHQLLCELHQIHSIASTLSPFEQALLPILHSLVSTSLILASSSLYIFWNILHSSTSYSIRPFASRLLDFSNSRISYVS